MSKTSRREFLLITGAAPLLLPILAKFTVASPQPDSKNVQLEWRRCSKCNLLFYNGLISANNIRLTGRCAAGGGHQAYRDNDYSLGYSIDNGSDFGSYPRQSGWRFCDKCLVLFYDGYTDKGRCPATQNRHTAQGFHFLLPHDNPGLVRKSGGWAGCEYQNNWRYCSKCHAMFYDGELTPFRRGKCQGGGQHLSQGYVFALEMAANCVPGAR